MEVLVQQHIGLGAQVTEHIPVDPFPAGHGNHQLAVRGYPLGELRDLFIRNPLDSGILPVQGHQPRQCPAIIIPGDNLQGVAILPGLHEQCLKVMETVRTFPEHVQAQVDFYRRVCNHVRKFFRQLIYT